MMKSVSNGGSIKQWASDLLDAAAGVQTVTVSLPGGQTGLPRKLRAGGAVAATVSIQFGNNAAVVVLVNPNAEPDTIDIPASAFPNPTNSVTLTVNASAAGYVSLAVGFA